MREITFSLSRRTLTHLALLFMLALGACAGLTGTPESPGSDDPTPPPTEPAMVLEGVGGGSVVFVPGGPFIMGSEETDPNSESDEWPQRRVNVPGFWIQQTEVTNEQYAACVAEGECAAPQQPLTFNDPAYAGHPVQGVTWFQANAYCEYLGGRLPTEAEWEKTARGLQAFTFPWGITDPDCDLTNQQGCNAPDNTDPIGTRDEGLSPFEAFDMAGNVGEWTYDWYTAGYYGDAPAANPYGPQSGELKVWRGGGYGDSGNALRTANRNALDPEEALPGLGFRCVLSAQEEIARAPFCQPSYTAFCNPGGSMETGLTHPDRPAGGEQPILRVAGFSCPQRGIVEVSVDLNVPSAEGYTMTVNGLPFTDCVELPEFPGRLYCKGPAAPQGVFVNVTICAPDGEAAAPNLNVVAYQPAGGETGLITYQPAAASLVAYNAYQQQTAPTNTDDYCPQGYIYNPLNGQCELDTTQPGCPDGWTYNPDLYRCEPNPEGGCPEGSQYDAQLGRCITTGDDCGDGFTLTHVGAGLRACEPSQNDDGGGLCPLGYFYDRSINCCSPIPQTGNGCEPGSVFDQLRGVCLPLDGNGCPAGSQYDPFKGCISDGEPTGGENPPYGQCPEGTTLDPASNTCIPNQPQTFAAAYVPDVSCPTGYSLNDLGQCMPEQGEPQDCGPQGYFDPTIGQCIVTPDGCGLGFYFNTATQSCLPQSGPGSQCGYGYRFDPAANCCVPVPGSDGTACPGDGELGSNGNQLVTWYAAAPTLYDVASQQCDPGGDGCPLGYRYDQERQACVPVITEDDCPDGTTYDPQRQTCTPDEGTECPDGYSYLRAVNGCQPDDSQQPQCEDGYYFNPQVGYCLPTDQNGCGVGYLAAGPEACAPDGGQPGSQCPTGFVYDADTNTCQPPGEGSSCWSIQVSVPVCQQPTVTPDSRCPVGFRFSEQTQSCEDARNQPTSTPGGNEPSSCADIRSMGACNGSNLGCSWDDIKAVCEDVIP